MTVLLLKCALWLSFHFRRSKHILSLSPDVRHMAGPCFPISPHCIFVCAYGKGSG